MVDLHVLHIYFKFSFVGKKKKRDQKSLSHAHSQCVWPVLAGDEANLLSLILRADLTGLPPLLISAVQHMQHIPKLEAQCLTEEATVRSLVIVKKSPVWLKDYDQSLNKKLFKMTLNQYYKQPWGVYCVWLLQGSLYV